jgi:predicted MPP superfamily phosphohydrolase
VLAVILFFFAYTPVRIHTDGAAMAVTHYTVGAGSREPPFRVLFMGDLQLDEHVRREQIDTLLDAAASQPLDLILSGGDWINQGDAYIEEAAQVAAGLRRWAPVLSVRGDHEHFAYRDQERSVEVVRAALERVGVELLDNQLRWYEHRGKRIAIAFVNYNYIVRSKKDEVDALLARMEGADYAIAVTHQLDETLAGWLRDRVDLVLSAHTHGGQVSPLVGFWHLPIARIETPFVRGRYRLSPRTYAIVTAGIGYSIAPFRFASPGSIDFIDISP